MQFIIKNQMVEKSLIEKLYTIINKYKYVLCNLIFLSFYTGSKVVITKDSIAIENAFTNIIFIKEYFKIPILCLHVNIFETLILKSLKNVKITESIFYS